MLAGTSKLKYSCPDGLSEKNHLFHKISYFPESFRTLGDKCSKLCPTLFFGRSIEKATYVSRGSLWRKAKFFKCFKKRCFSYNCLRIVIGEVCTFGKKTIVLVLKTLFYVSRGTFSEKIFVSKSFFFLKIHGIWEKNFRIFVMLFPARLTSFHPTFAEEGFRGKISQKKFLSLFPDWEQKIDYRKDIKMNVKTLFYVSGGNFWGKTLFSKLYDILFHVFRAKNCKIWKKNPQNCKNSILHV